MTEHKTDEILGSLNRLFYNHLGRYPEQILALPGAGSSRLYFRLYVAEITFIGSFNPDPVENKAFLRLSDLFFKKKLSVPQVLAENTDEGICLIEDLGDTDLLRFIGSQKPGTDLDTLRFKYYSMALDQLIRFQVIGGSGLDYSLLPVPEFNSNAMLWDLNYFKYYFLKPSGILFDESALDSDFRNLAEFLSEEKVLGFMYRDFQARNIMVKNNQLYFIDFQGGRRGPLQYDVASLLFQVKAGLTPALRSQLFDYYLSQLRKHLEFDEASFISRFDGFVLLRMLQVMGAYGFRGWFERKLHFLESIKLLTPNIQHIIENIVLIRQLPELERILFKMNQHMISGTLGQQTDLTVSINSFSYRRGIPYDSSGHGGGFVFDCRLLTNPGLQEQFKNLTGLDREVMEFLSGQPEVRSFIELAAEMVKQSVKSYQKAQYTDLQVSFGCTGGQHRSVYCAQALAGELMKSGIKTKVMHHELKNK